MILRSSFKYLYLDLSAFIRTMAGEVLKKKHFNLVY